MHVSAEEGRQKSVQNGLDALSSCITSLDSGLDKQKFLEYNHSAFMIPKKLEFQGQKTDDVSKDSYSKFHTCSKANSCQIKIQDHYFTQLINKYLKKECVIQRILKIIADKFNFFSFSS